MTLDIKEEGLDQAKGSNPEIEKRMLTAEELSNLIREKSDEYLNSPQLARELLIELGLWKVE